MYHSQNSLLNFDDCIRYFFMYNKYIHVCMYSCMCVCVFLCTVENVMVFIVRLTSLQMTEGKQSIVSRRRTQKDRNTKESNMFSMKAVNRADHQSGDIDFQET